MTSPADVYPLRRDRTMQAQPQGRTKVTAGWRVHFRVIGMPADTHRVSDIFWEHEARDFANVIAATPGMELVTNKTRPDGIERVYGSNAPKSAHQVMPDSTVYYEDRSADYGRTYRDAEPVEKFLAVLAFKKDVLDRIAGSESLTEKCLAIFNEAAQE